jgi:hypothetical protein
MRIGILRSAVVAVVTTLLLTTFCAAQEGTDGKTAGRGDRPNALALELLGRCGYYGLTYQRLIADNLGLEAAASLRSQTNSSLLWFTGGGRVYLTPQDVSISLAAGFGTLTQSATVGPFSDKSSSVYFYFGPAVESRTSSGFFLRAALYFFRVDRELITWPGAELGMAF